MATTLGRPTGRIASLYAGYVVLLVSPTGLDGFCKGLNRLMGHPL